MRSLSTRPPAFPEDKLQHVQIASPKTLILESVSLSPFVPRPVVPCFEKQQIILRRGHGSGLQCLVTSFRSRPASEAWFDNLERKDLIE
jgi:hypothetical protein